MARAKKEDGSKRIHWRDEEKEKIARSAAISFHTGISTTKMHALREGIKEMPENRRRIINGMSEAPWFDDMFSSALALVKKAQEQVDARAAEPEPAPVVVPPEPTIAEELRPVLVNWLAGIFRDALTTAVREIAGADHTSSISMTPSKLETVLNGALKKPSMLIAGLKGAQKQVIVAEFGHLVDLRFYESDKSKDQLRAMAETADVSIAFTDFLNHSHTDIIQARARMYIPSGGGMSQLKDTIKNAIAKLH